MALPTVAECKALLRIQHTADDPLLTSLLAQATAAVEAALGGVPIVAADRTMEVARLTYRGALADVLHLPAYPVDDTSVVLTDGESVQVDDTTYRVEPTTGRLVGFTGTAFGAGPYVVDARVGWDAHPDYLTRYEPVLSRAILATVAEWWARRNPSATSEQAGGGVGTSYGAPMGGLPAHARELLREAGMLRARLLG